MTQAEIINYSKQRAILETQLCTEMYDIYNRSPILGHIREIVGTAIEQILVMMQMKSIKSLGWDGAIKKAGGNLAVWRLSGSAPRETAAALMNVWEKSSQWTADDCGDLIRLFGGLIEDKALQAGSAVDVSVDKARDGKRQFGFGKDERSRTTDGFNQTIAHVGQAHMAILGSKRVQGGFSGIGKISLTDMSTVKRIDSAYGLAEGCDISGTTADSIFFFDHVNTFISGLPGAIPSEMLPVIQLFPMATMGSQGHHTVLECALTLTQNSLIKYRVGFYSTLMPEGSSNAALSGLFSKYESDPRNIQMLCWWDGTKLGGVRFDKPWEVNMLKQASLAGPALLQDFKALGANASKKQLLAMARYRTLGQMLGIG